MLLKAILLKVILLLTAILLRVILLTAILLHITTQATQVHLQRACSLININTLQDRQCRQRQQPLKQHRIRIAYSYLIHQFSLPRHRSESSAPSVATLVRLLYPPRLDIMQYFGPFAFHYFGVWAGEFSVQMHAKTNNIDVQFAAR